MLLQEMNEGCRLTVHSEYIQVAVVLKLVSCYMRIGVAFSFPMFVPHRVGSHDDVRLRWRAASNMMLGGLNNGSKMAWSHVVLLRMSASRV